MCCTHVDVQELRQAFQDEHKANDRLIEQSDKDKQMIDSLEERCTGPGSCLQASGLVQLPMIAAGRC